MTEKVQKLKLGIPAGSLQKATVELFNKAGYRMSDAARNYRPRIDDDQIECISLRAQEMSRYVSDGVLDAGITGYDWICENDREVIEVCELNYSKATSKPARWVLAVPQESTVKKPEDLAGKLVATELLNVTSRYFDDKGIDVKVEFSWGATEVKARLGEFSWGDTEVEEPLVAAIVDLTETGSSLRANNLRVIDTILTSTTRFIANKAAWDDPFKREKIDYMAILLQAAIEARSWVGLKMNAEKADLEAVLKELPAEKSPTISPLADSESVAIEVILENSVERTIVPALKRAGASGIFTYPLNKVIH